MSLRIKSREKCVSMWTRSGYYYGKKYNIRAVEIRELQCGLSSFFRYKIGLTLKR